MLNEVTVPNAAPKQASSPPRASMTDYQNVVKELKTTKESLFQANYLLSNAKKQIEYLQKESKEKDRKIQTLIRTNVQMQHQHRLSMSGPARNLEGSREEENSANTAERASGLQQELSGGKHGKFLLLLLCGWKRLI